MTLDDLGEIIDLTLKYRREIGEQFTADVRDRAMLAADSARPNILVDSLACEILRCRIPNHQWSGAIG